MNRQYKVRELRRIVKESAKELQNPKQEFEPVVYNDGEDKINRDAYKQMKNDVKDYDGGAREEKKSINYPFTDNRGMEDIEYDNKLSSKKKADIKAQREGWVNDQAKKLHQNDQFGNAFHTKINGIDKHVKALAKGKELGKEMGLTAHNLPKDTFTKSKDEVDESKISRLTFKNTTFLTEQHMLSRVPDNYKTEGRKFIMRDKANHQYLVEWHVDDDPKITNQSRIVEEQNRIKQLFNYKREESGTTNKLRLTENNKINDMLNRTRQLMK